MRKPVLNKANKIQGHKTKSSQEKANVQIKQIKVKEKLKKKKS